MDTQNAPDPTLALTPEPTTPAEDDREDFPFVLPDFMVNPATSPTVEPVLPLPDWMLTEFDEVVPKRKTPQVVKDLQDEIYGNLFEHVLDGIAGGENLMSLLNRDSRGIQMGRFIRWIMRDEQRKARYYAAQETGAEIICAEIQAISDGEDTLEDVQRSKLRIDTRKWLMGVHNRKRFGEKSEVNVQVVDLTEAMAKAAARVANRSLLIEDGKVVDE